MGSTAHDGRHHDFSPNNASAHTAKMTKKLLAEN